MRATLERAALVAHVHTTNTGGHSDASASIEPLKLALHLQCKFACWRDDKGEGTCSRAERAILGQDCRTNCKAEADSFTRTSLGRNQQVFAFKLWVCHFVLNRSKGFVTLFCQCIGKGLNHRFHS